MDVYQVITDRIIEKLEQGTVPWHKPWRSIGAPRNLASKKPYRGVNVWLLTAAGYTSPYWATIRQVNELGGSVRKGEKATPVVFWRIYVDGVEAKAGEPESQETEGQDRRRFVLRYYSVFNAEQCETSRRARREAQRFPRRRTIDPIEACEKILADMPDPAPRFAAPATRLSLANYRLRNHAARAACLRARRNTGRLSARVRGSRDRPPEAAEPRLEIKEAAPFGSETYSIEECIAEMAAAYFCRFTGIENRTIDNRRVHRAWLKSLREDRKLIIHAAAQCAARVRLVCPRRESRRLLRRGLRAALKRLRGEDSEAVFVQRALGMDDFRCGRPIFCR